MNCSQQHGTQQKTNTDTKQNDLLINEESATKKHTHFVTWQSVSNALNNYVWFCHVINLECWSDFDFLFWLFEYDFSRT